MSGQYLLQIRLTLLQMKQELQHLKLNSLSFDKNILIVLCLIA